MQFTFAISLSSKSLNYLFNRRFNGLFSTIKVPTVGVIGSGGGFRAMVAYSGVFNALKKSGILDVTSYVAGLSGSSW